MTPVGRIFVSALSGAVVIFVQAGIFFGVIFADFFANSIPSELAGVSKASVNYAIIFASDFIYASMLAFVFARLADIKTFRRGALAGMIIGFGVVTHLDLISMATTNLTTPASVAVNVATSTLMSAVGGGVIGAVLGRLADGSKQ